MEHRVWWWGVGREDCRLKLIRQRRAGTTAITRLVRIELMRLGQNSSQKKTGGGGYLAALNPRRTRLTPGSEVRWVTRQCLCPRPLGTARRSSLPESAGASGTSAVLGSLLSPSPEGPSVPPSLCGRRGGGGGFGFELCPGFLPRQVLFVILSQFPPLF